MGFQVIVHPPTNISCPASTYDEMRATDGGIRPPYQAFAGWLERTPPERIAQKREEAERAFHRLGITFAVYGEESGTERLIPFDLVPRIISGDEWKVLDRGLKQRVQALNAFLRDIYHDQAILKAGVVPAERVLGKRAVPQRDAGHRRPGRHLRAHRRRRPRPRGRRRVLRARGQPAGPLRRVLHAREPQDDDAALSRALRDAAHPAGPALSGPAAGEPLRARAGGRGAPDGRRADARRPQLRVLRARVPGAADGRRAGRGAGPVRPERHRLHAHDARAAARARDLPARRRRLPRSAGVSSRFDARRARPVRRLPRRDGSRSPTRSAPASPTTSRSIRTCRT